MLTHSRVELAQAELRLRRIESFVTSDQYELHKELRKNGAIKAMDLWTMIVLVVAIGCGAGVAESYFKTQRAKKIPAACRRGDK